MAISYSTQNDIIVPTVNGETYLGGAGDDTYILTNAVTADATLVLQDTEGVNTIQLVDGLSIASSTVYNDALMLTLSNDAQVQITGASSFSFEPSGNDTTGDTGTEQDYTTFIENTLGTTVPAEGEGPTTGDEVTIGEGTSDAPGLFMSSVQGEPGGTVELSFTLNTLSETDIAALSTDITYDSSVLSNPTAEIGTAADAAGKSIVSSSPDDDIFRVAVLSMSNAEPITDGIVFELSFDISAEADIGSELELLQEASASNPEGEAVEISGTSGTVEIVDEVQSLGVMGIQEGLFSEMSLDMA